MEIGLIFSTSPSFKQKDVKIHKKCFAFRILNRTGTFLRDQ
jgi:hypothetical protein